MKACSVNVAELVAWAEEESGAEPAYCEQCEPTDDSVSLIGPHDRRLTKLGKEIVDAVVETAVIHLDHQDSGYTLTVGDVAKYFDKTPGQITQPLLRLIEVGYLRVQGEVMVGEAFPADRQIYPTGDALRTLPAFEQLSKRKIETELEMLSDEEE